MNQIKKLALTLSVVSLAGTAVAEVNQPLEIVNRPLTAPAGQIEAQLSFGLGFAKDQDPYKFLGLPSLVSPGAYSAPGLSLAYGINDKLDARVGLSTCLEEDCDFKGPISLELGYGLSSGGPLHLAADVGIGYDTLFEGLTPLQLGARVRYNLDDKMAVYSPGQQLTITLDDKDTGISPIYLSLPVGFGYQASPNLFVAVETSLANLEISDSETAVLFADMIPVGLRAFYAINSMIDVGASFDIDLDDTDASLLGITARAFF